MGENENQQSSSSHVNNRPHWFTAFILLMKKYLLYAVCQSIRGVFISWMKTDEIWKAAKWHSQRSTRVGCQPMNFVLSINPFRYYWLACKCEYLFCGQSHSTMRLVWNEIIEWNISMMFPAENGFRLFFYLIGLAATEGTCSGLCYSGWSIPVSSMLVLVTFKPSPEFVMFIKLFRHTG